MVLMGGGRDTCGPLWLATYMLNAIKGKESENKIF